MHKAASITYDRATGAYRVTFDGTYIGHAPSHLKGEELVDDHVYDLRNAGLMPPEYELEQGHAAVACFADDPAALPIERAYQRSVRIYYPAPRYGSPL